MNKVLVVHAGKQHSFHLAKALLDKNILVGYVTTIYNKPKSLTRFVSKILKGDNRIRAESRQCPVLNPFVFQYYEFLSIFTLLLSKLKLNKIASSIYKYVQKKTYFKAIKLSLRLNADCIVFYDGFEKCHYDLIKKINPSLKIIIDVATPTELFWKKAIENDIEANGNLIFRDEELGILENKTLYFDEYVSFADYFIVPSTISEKSLNEYGIQSDRILRVPCGVDLSLFSSPKATKEFGSSIKFLFVGNVTFRKGIHLLLKSFNQLPGNNELFIAGLFDKKESFVIENMTKSNIHFLGHLTQEKLSILYKNCNVLVFPTLMDGFGLSCLEAMASGLPVVCSDAAGVSDIISNSNEGLIFKSSNTDELLNSMIFFINNPQFLKIMGEKSIELAKEYTWEKYEEEIGKKLKDLD